MFEKIEIVRITERIKNENMNCQNPNDCIKLTIKNK